MALSKAQSDSSNSRCVSGGMTLGLGLGRLFGSFQSQILEIVRELFPLAIQTVNELSAPDD
jgi:hypothetical protein